METQQPAQKRKGIFLNIEYQRISPADKTGMLDITCEWEQEWVYSDAGSHHGAQCESAESEDSIMKFGCQLSDLIKQYFGEIAPILSE